MLLVALLVLCCPAHCLGNRKEACTSWSPLSQGACPLAADPVAVLQLLLDDRLAGQALAASTVRKAVAQNTNKFKTNFERKRDKFASYLLGFPYSVLVQQGRNSSKVERDAMLLHFSGPTGVGKTLTANLVGHALFTASSDCGIVTINLNEHRALKKGQMARFLETTLQRFKDQLVLCPRSLFVLDEIQNVQPELVHALVSFFQPKGKLMSAVASAYPIVILVSDLGSQQLNSNMSRAEAVAAIQIASSHRFGGSSDWLNGKDADAILGSNLVPFLPLSEDDLTAVAAMELASLQAQLRVEFGGSWRGKVTWHPRVPASLAAMC
mmetsp:Transcript_105753/g.170244  ORF Transcript_105753/g.170244 Transcript_105753/m.170244 type:complete len:324 (+) Transcript_105753:29-1000(+)